MRAPAALAACRTARLCFQLALLSLTIGDVRSTCTQEYETCNLDSCLLEFCIGLCCHLARLSLTIGIVRFTYTQEHESCNLDSCLIEFSIRASCFWLAFTLVAEGSAAPSNVKRCPRQCKIMRDVYVPDCCRKEGLAKGQPICFDMPTVGLRVIDKIWQVWQSTDVVCMRQRDALCN